MTQAISAGASHKLIGTLRLFPCHCWQMGNLRKHFPSLPV